MFSWFKKPEESTFLHDVYLAPGALTSSHDGMWIAMEGHNYLATRAEFCVSEGHSTWEGLCTLLIDNFHIDRLQAQKRYLVCWVEEKTVSWSEEDGSYYAMKRLMVNQNTSSKVIASYIFNPDVDFFFKVVENDQADIFLNSPFYVNPTLLLPNQDPSTWVTIAPVVQIGTDIRTKSPV